MNNKNLFKNKIKRIFLRNGGDGKQVKLFDSFSDSEKTMLQGFQLSVGETPLLGGILEDGPLMLLTTDNLFTDTNGVVDFVSLEEIKQIEFDLHSLSVETKPQIDCVPAVTIRGKRFLIRVEKGSPFFGLLNVLLFIERNNKSQSSISGEIVG